MFALMEKELVNNFKRRFHVPSFKMKTHFTHLLNYVNIIICVLLPGEAQRRHQVILSFKPQTFLRVASNTILNGSLCEA